jgi:hypothetical protein
MTTQSPIRTSSTITIDQILESAVILSWADLTHAMPGLVHVEYHTGQDRSLLFLKVWSSTIRGHWNLVCEYWTEGAYRHPAGLAFSPGHKSAAFTQLFGSIVEHWDRFSKEYEPESGGLVQIQTPVEKQTVEAGHRMARAMEPVDDFISAPSRLERDPAWSAAHSTELRKKDEAPSDECRLRA